MTAHIVTNISHINWTEWSAIHEVIARVISKWEDEKRKTDLICTPPGPITYN